MRLYEVCPEAREQGLVDTDINSICDNDKNLKKDDIFVCITGNNFDGHNVGADMLFKGASAVIVERDLGLDRQVIVENTRDFLSTLASRFYREPTKKLKMLAVTGTNGKTTTTHLVKFILDGLGHKTGLIGTSGYDVGDKIYEAHLSTPCPMDLYRYFREMVDNGLEFCIMEASSQALAQYRIAHENFMVSGFTNLTQDHLDYHGTMENYYEAKKSLFSMSQSAIINIDDDYGKRLISEIDCRIKTCGINTKADFKGEYIDNKSSGISYWFVDNQREKSFPVSFKMPGLFNASNSIMAIAMCEEIGFSPEQCIEQLGKCRGVTGRIEVIYDGEFTVISDYAHTEDALEKVLSTVREFTKGKLICLFGAAGERDTTKRHLMGECAAKLSDHIIVTSDNPRFEDPQLIISQVLEGVKKHNTPYNAYVDRMEAIKFALATADRDDVVVLAGKGHETYQVIGDDYQDFDEHKIVQSIMNKCAERDGYKT